MVRKDVLVTTNYETVGGGSRFAPVFSYQWSVGAGGANLVLDTPTALNSKAQRRVAHAGLPITHMTEPQRGSREEERVKSEE